MFCAKMWVIVFHFLLDKEKKSYLSGKTYGDFS
jgi:hypothetical protein